MQIVGHPPRISRTPGGRHCCKDGGDPDQRGDRRRVRLHTLLLGYGEPVQDSLFECELDERQVRIMRAKLRRMLAPDDKVRIYPLCAACATRIDDARGRRRPAAPEVHIA